MKSLPLVLALAASVTAAQGSVQYVDATSANTSGQASFPTAGNIYNDNLWSIRTLTANDAVNATIWEAGPTGGGEDAPVISTLISGLIPGESYQIYLYYLTFPTSDANQLWRLQAGFSEASLSLFNRDTVGSIVLPDGNTTLLVDPSNNPVTIPATRDYRQGTIGITTASPTGTISVFVDAAAGTNDANHRAWYDGVGYEVVPEPGTAVLSLLAGVGLVAMRRRR